MLERTADTISPSESTTAFPSDRSVAMHLNGILNFEKSLMLYTGINNSFRVSQSVSDSIKSGADLGFEIFKSEFNRIFSVLIFFINTDLGKIGFIAQYGIPVQVI